MPMSFTTPLLNNPRVHLFKSDFGYVEFSRPEDATLATTQQEHMIKGKKASIQFFKSKELQSKKAQPVQEMHNRPLAPSFYPVQGHQESKQFLMPPARALLPQVAESFNVSSFCAGQAHPNFPLDNQGGYLAINTSKTRQFIVQPKRSKIAGLETRYHDFYMSLNRAEEARCCHNTYSTSNLRFNRLSSSSN